MVNGLMVLWQGLKRSDKGLRIVVSCALALWLTACSGDGIGGRNTAPTVSLEVDQASGPAPLTVSFASNATDDDDDDLSYVWNPGEGEPVVGGPDYTHTYLEPGTYTATVTVSDGNDAITESVTIEVAGDPLEVNLTASPNAGSVPLTVTFASSTTGTDNTDLTYTFDFGNGDTTALNGGGALNYDYTYTEPGIYEAEVLARNAEGELARSSIIITASEPAPPRQGPTAILSASAVAGAAPLNVNFDASASTDDTGDLIAYTWTFGDGSSANGVQVSHVYEQEGEFTVVLTVTNNNG
ncbi:MAG: PKD domain-containing protein, partial [Deinococcota bacterium]